MKFSSRLNEDYPDKKSIDNLTINTMKDMSLYAPMGYFQKGSNLVMYFFSLLDPSMSNEDWKIFETEYDKRVTEEKEKVNGKTKLN